MKQNSDKIWRKKNSRKRKAPLHTTRNPCQMTCPEDQQLEAFD